MTRLLMMDCFKDRPTSIKNALWGCKGVSRTTAKIALTDGKCDIIQQISIRVGSSATFNTGHVVKVTNLLLSGKDSYADVHVTATSTPGLIPSPTPSPTTTQTNVLVNIPNKDGTFKSYTYTIEVPGSPGIVEDVEPVVCTEGEKSGPITCWDGTVIHTLICRNNKWVPTGEICPSAPQAKTVSILVLEGKYNLPNTYQGKEVIITAAVMCGTKKSQHEPAFLKVNGKIVAESKTGQGSNDPMFVTFKWTATTGTHTICVKVPKSDACPEFSEAQDCKTIIVSANVPSIEDRLDQERQELSDRLKSIREARKQVRDELKITTTPEPEKIPFPEVPIPEVPAPGEPVPEVPAPEVPAPEVPDTGIIKIPSIPVPPNVSLIPSIFIDNKLMGQPPLEVEVPAGKRKIRIELKGFEPLHKTITVTAGETIAISDLLF